MSNLKKQVKEAVAKIPEKSKAGTAAREALTKALNQNKGSKRAISPKELQRIQDAARNAGGSKKTVRNLVGIVHPQNAPPPPPPDTPSTSTSTTSGSTSPVGVPSRDVITLATTNIDSETIINLLFENIGANELTKFVRHDTVEGTNPYYDIISNLSDIKKRFNPSELISSQKSDFSNFDIFSISLQDKIPDEKYLQDNDILDYIFFAENGDLVIELVNITDSELIEVQIDTNGTIYEMGES